MWLNRCEIITSSVPSISAPIGPLRAAPRPWQLHRAARLSQHPPPSTSDNIEGIFGQPRDGNPDRWIRISLTKAGAPINEGSASAGACCAGGGAAEPLVLLQRGTELPFCQLSLPCCSAKQREGSPRTSGEAGWAGSRTELLNYFAVVTIVLFFNSSGLRAAIYLLFGVILFVL